MFQFTTCSLATYFFYVENTDSLDNRLNLFCSKVFYFKNYPFVTLKLLISLRPSCFYGLVLVRYSMFLG